MSDRREDIPGETEGSWFAADDGGRPVPAAGGEPWQLLIVDDEQVIHDVTRLVLGSYTFDGRGLELLSARSGAEARAMLQAHPDIAVVLLDVVMETDHAGLEVVEYARQELGNRLVRIILRTGQPGQAPEQKVVEEYDINDYKAKTELTVPKLYTTVTSALRAYRDLRALDRSRRGLKRVIHACGRLMATRSQREFAGTVLDQLVAILRRDAAAADGIHGAALVRDGEEDLVLAGTGRFAGELGRPAAAVLPAPVLADLAPAVAGGEDRFLPQGYLGCVTSPEGETHLLYLELPRPWRELEKDLVRIFTANVAVAYENVLLNREIIDTQKEIILTLGEVVETRSQETASHVLRVGELAHLLALRAGLDRDEADILKLAAPMHDVGKIGIPDAILQKPDRLSDGERRLMESHTVIGHELLGKSSRRIMRTAAVLALQHHERWDGGGYPHGLRGEAIHPHGRITGLVDVFDALSSRRVYRDALPLDEVFAHLEREAGRHFDPELARVLLAHRDEFAAILARHPDARRSGEPTLRGFLHNPL